MKRCKKKREDTSILRSFHIQYTSYAMFISRLHFPVASWLSTRGFQIKRSRVQLQHSGHNFNYNIYFKNESSSIADCFNINKQQWQTASTRTKFWFLTASNQTATNWYKKLCFICFLSIHTGLTREEVQSRNLSSDLFQNNFQNMFEIFDTHSFSFSFFYILEIHERHSTRTLFFSQKLQKFWETILQTFCLLRKRKDFKSSFTSKKVRTNVQKNA